jgi:hypothetical protein
MKNKIDCPHGLKAADCYTCHEAAEDAANFSKRMHKAEERKKEEFQVTYIVQGYYIVHGRNKKREWFDWVQGLPTVESARKTVETGMGMLASVGFNKLRIIEVTKKVVE